MSNILHFDTETLNAGTEYNHTPEEHFRLGQYAWNDGPVEKTTGYEQFCDIVRSADVVSGHNIISYDLSVLFGQDSLEALTMAMDGRVIDTFYLAHLVTPAPVSFVDRNGRRHTLTPSQSPIGHAKSWLALDNLAFQFGLPGKIGDLKALAKKYNPPKTLVTNLDYSLIPLDDPEFLEYADGDVIAQRALHNYLMEKVEEQGYDMDYILREMELLSATVGQMSRNGILVDTDYATQEIEKQEAQKRDLMNWLEFEYDFPTEGKAPWSSSAGKTVILEILAGYGIDENTRPDWPRTPTGALKLGGDDLKMVTEGTEAYDFACQLAALKGQRSTHQQVMDALKPDGRVHPKITSLQRSGRWSFTDPGITIFGERSEKLREEKRLFRAAEGKVLVGFDYASADARAMGAMSGDPEFNRRFEQDENGNDLYDSHNLTGESFFGADVYYGDGPRDKNARPILRAPSKNGGHGLNYNLGAFKMAHTLNDVCRKEKIEGLHFWAPKHEKSKSNFPEIEKREDSIDTRDMINSFNEKYAWLKMFKDSAVKEAEDFGYVTNTWGRRMVTDRGREWTQAPALKGQSTTREMMGDAILRLCHKGDYYALALRAIIHDELLMEFDEDTVERDIAIVKECMEVPFDPGTKVGVVMPFPVGYGYGKNWMAAGH